jgi:SAM-dependent methyltransferase
MAFGVARLQSAWVSMPPTMKALRPMRSESAPARTVSTYAQWRVKGMLRPFRSQRALRRRLDRSAGYGAGYGCEWVMIRDSRSWVCRQARGRTLELGVGTGLNLRWYPRDVQMVGVDLDRERLEISAARAVELGRAIKLAVADAQRLPFPREAFDTVVCTLAICDVHDREASLTEMYRVVRPGGLLLLLDHVEARWRHGRPATIAVRVGFTVALRERLWLGYFERVRLQKPLSSQIRTDGSGEGCGPTS